jgi:hypothetical protein
VNDDFNEQSEPELTADEQALLDEMPALTDVGQTRRAFVEQTMDPCQRWFTNSLALSGILHPAIAGMASRTVRRCAV